MNDKLPNPQANQGCHDDALARELTKLHQQVAGVRNSPEAGVSEAQDFDDATSWKTAESDPELQSQLQSAKRVMELLVKTRPQPGVGLTDPD
jgi:hypothetical protein